MAYYCFKHFDLLSGSTRLLNAYGIANLLCCPNHFNYSGIVPSLFGRANFAETSSIQCVSLLLNHVALKEIIGLCKDYAGVLRTRF